MRINENENIILVDIDNTLILHNGKKEIELNYYGMVKWAGVHKEHIRLLKSYKQRGFFIRAHSNNGWQWTKEVIEKLGLEDIVNDVESKPTRFMDDVELEHNEVVGMRVYISPEKP